MAPGRTPRAWQVDAAAAVVAAWTRGERPLIEVATGAGKGDWLVGMLSWLALAEQASAAKMGRRARRCAIVVHRQDLVLDLAQRLAAVALRRGLSVGVVMGDRRDYGADVLVISVDSMTEQAVKCLGPLRCLIIDEAHHAPSGTYTALLRWVAAVAASEAPGLTFLLGGVTATGFRGDEVGLGAVFSHLVYTYGMRQAIADGVLVPPVFVDAAAKYEGPTREAAEDVTAPARLDYAASYYVSQDMGESAVVVCKSKAHASAMLAAFRRVGVSSEMVHSTMSDAERQRVLGGFRDGTIPVVVAIDLILEGFDVPRCSRVYLCRVMKSPVQMRQLAGRALRLFPGKTEARIVDFVGTATKLGWGMDEDADLSKGKGDPAKKAAAPLGIEVGAWVRLLAEAEWPAGEVVEVMPRSVLRIAWPEVDGWARSGTRSEHRAAEVAQVAPDADRLLAQVRIVRLPGGVQVQMLDGATTAWPWVELGRGWCAGGRTAGVVERNLSAWAYQLSAGGWSVWAVEHLSTGMGTAQRIGGTDHRIQALRAGERWLVQQGARPAGAETGADLAPSAASVRLLQSAGVPVPSTRGAAALMGRAVAARAAVEEAQRSRRAQAVVEHRAERAELAPHVEALLGRRLAADEPATARRIEALASAWQRRLASVEGSAERGAAERELRAAGVGQEVLTEIAGPERPGGLTAARMLAACRVARDAARGAR